MTKNNDAAHWRASGLFLLILGVYILCSPAHFLTTQDEELNLRTTLSLIEGQKGAIPPVMGGFASKTGIDGKEYAQYGLGVPIAYAAWCFVGLQLDPSENTLPNYLINVDHLNPAGTPFLRWWITLFTMMLTSLTVVMTEKILRHIGLHKDVSLVFALILALGTYMMPHGRTLFTEPLVAFCLTGALLNLLQYRKHPEEIKFALFAGIFWAYAVFTRLDTLVTLPAAAWFIFMDHAHGKFKISIRSKAAVSFAVPFAVVMIVILLYNQYRFDSLFSTGYEDQQENIKFATPLLVGLQGFLFTPGRSLFLYSPMLIFFPWGFFHLYKKDAWFAVGLGILCALFLGVMCKWQNWAGGWDWGPRHIYQLTPLLFIMSAAFFTHKTLWDTTWKKAGWICLAALSIFIQCLGLSADPVQTTAQLLETFSAPYAENAPRVVPAIRGYAQQFMVYLPQFSSPVLHWQEIQRQGADLSIIRNFAFSTAYLSWIITSLIMVLCGYLLLFRSAKNNTQGS